jgi:predicted transcriptional regulator
MPRKPSSSLTEAEQRVMQALWDAGEASVRDVHEQLSKKHDLAYTTILTILKILAEKGHAGHRKEGRAFIYYPLLSQKDARQRALSQVVSRFFGGSAQALAEHLTELEDIDLDELRALRAEIEKEKSTK